MSLYVLNRDRLSVPRDQQRYESYRRRGRSLSPAGGGKGGICVKLRK